MFIGDTIDPHLSRRSAATLAGVSSGFGFPAPQAVAPASASRTNARLSILIFVKTFTHLNRSEPMTISDQEAALFRHPHLVRWRP